MQIGGGSQKRRTSWGCTWTKPQGPLCNRHCPADDDDVGDNDDDNGGGGGFDDGYDGGRGGEGLWTKDHHAPCSTVLMMVMIMMVATMMMVKMLDSRTTSTIKPAPFMRARTNVYKFCRNLWGG